MPTLRFVATHLLTLLLLAAPFSSLNVVAATTTFDNSTDPQDIFRRPWLAEPGTLPDDRLDYPKKSLPQALFFPTWAYPDPEDPDRCIPVVQGVLIQRPKKFSTGQKIILGGYRLAWKPHNKQERERLESRMRYFFAHTLGEKSERRVATVSGVTVGGEKVPSLHVKRNGRFELDDRSNVYLPERFHPGTIATIKYDELPRANGTQYGRVHVYGSTGYTIITDIDDTIKDTHVIVYKQMFRKAFMEEYKPIRGMPELFQHLETQLSTPESPDVAFHYVSGTPYSLLPSIDRFIVNASFPLGPIHLAQLRFKDPKTVIALTEYTHFKVVETHRVVKSFPRRKLILFGDSGQHDAAAYAKLMREDPTGKRYVCAFIRLVTGVNAKRERKLNKRSIFLRAFNGVDMQRWYLFKDPKELMEVEWEKGRCRPPNVPDSEMGGGL